MEGEVAALTKMMILNRGTGNYSQVYQLMTYKTLTGFTQFIDETMTGKLIYSPGALSQCLSAWGKNQQGRLPPLIEVCR